MKGKYAFLSLLIPDELKEEYKSLSRNNMQDAANALQWHIYNGICENLQTEVRIFNTLPIGSFPQYYKKPFIKRSKFKTFYCDNNINIGFCNIKFLRKLFLASKVFKELNDWCKDKEKKILFVYTLNSGFLEAITRLKLLYSNLKVCAIVADLPNMSSLSNKKSLLKRIFENRLTSKSYKNLKCVDYFVLLTQPMATYMKIEKPYCVMEGIATENIGALEKKSQPITEIEKNIVYTGTLHERFGILNLLQAFKEIPYPNYRLIICGIGDSEKKIIEASKQDSRIIFMGQLSRDEILKLQKVATVLVNPRQNNEEFTKYSFPSKNLEYLSSGIPLVAYKLDGILDEYDDYINYVEDNSIVSLRNKLIEVCEWTYEKRELFGYKAQKFVLEQKNQLIQTKKIIELIEL